MRWPSCRRNTFGEFGFFVRGRRVIWKKEKKCQAKEYMRCVTTPVQFATKKDILITRRYVLHVQAQVARIKSTVYQQEVSVVISFSHFPV
jgi:hypothetical protein